MADLREEYTAIHRDVLLFLKTPFVLPCTSKPLDFNLLVGSSIPENSRELLKLATLQRNKLLEVLADPKYDVRNVIAAVDAYLPSLWQITASMQVQDAQIKLVKKLEFKWTSPLSKHSKVMQTGFDFLFETSFVLTIRALAHRDAAKLVLQESGDDLTEEMYSSISKELRLGAGIFDFMANDLLVRWQQPAEMKQVPLEMNRLVHSCMSALFIADSQRIAICKALLVSKSSPTVLCKLLLGCAEKYEFATRSLTQISKTDFDSVIPGLLEELGAFPAILRACAYNLCAQQSWAKCEYANGLGYAKEAVKRLGVITMGKGLQASPLQHALDDGLKRTLSMEKSYENDCTQVYFEKPTLERDLKLPDASFIMNPIVYELPLALVVSFSSTGEKKQPSVQNFWSSLWAKPEDYPETSEESLVRAQKMSGAKGELPSTFMPEPPQVTSEAPPAYVKKIECPKGMDPNVFASLPEDIQREIAQEHQAS